MSKVKQFEFAKLQVKEAAKLSRLYLGNQLKGEAI